MSLYNYLSRIRRLDGMIRRKSTGSPKELADKLDISERWLYNLLDELKMELDCPIVYDRHRQSYVYKVSGEMFIGFQPQNLSKEEKKQIRGGISKKIFSLYLFVQWRVIN